MSADPFIGLRRAFYSALRPPRFLDMASWIEASVRLPASVSAESGRMQLMPWQREVARSIGNASIERVSVLKSARVGATQLMVAGIGHYALNDPSPQLVVMPSEGDCKMLLTSIIEPTFAASPDLRNALTENVSGRDTMLSRHYPGGSLALVSGASPKNLRARTARVLWLDEVDGLELSAGAEGDPVALAIRRTMSYGTRRKVVMMSTPVDEATSRILRAYEEGDQRVWELPCLQCGDFHELKWSMIQWPEGRPEAAHFVCPSCGCVTEERDKPAMIDRGRWRATRPEVAGHHSYRLNTFGASTLPTAAWGVLAGEFVAAKRDPHLLKTWVNTVAGEVWRDESDGLDDSDLLARREPFSLDSIPVEVLVVVGGADVQHDRIELTTMGWTAEGAALVLAHEILWGDPFGSDLWHNLDALIKRTWPHKNGGTLRYDAVLIDASDGTTMDHVLNFTRGRASARVFPLKGVSGWRQPAVALGKAAGKAWARLQLVGVDPIKRRLMDMITGGSLRLSDNLGANWAEQMCGERLRTRYSRGRPVLEWYQLGGRRVEALDCAVYCIAARALVTVNMEARHAELSTAAAPKAQPRVIRSKWMAR